MIKINKKLYDDESNIYTRIILAIGNMKVRFHWFTEEGEWFIYLIFFKYWVRFSSCGFLRGRKD